ncbi:transposase [Geobacillus zalihae]
MISDIFGVSGRKLLTRLMEQGYIEEADIDACLHGRMKGKKQQIQESLFGTLTEHELFMIRQSWKHIEYLESLIQEMDQRIDHLLQPYQQEVELLMTMPGVKKRNRRRHHSRNRSGYGTVPDTAAPRFLGWGGPGNHESAGKRKSTRTVKGNPHIKSALCEAAWALSRCRNQPLAAKFWSLAARQGKKKSTRCDRAPNACHHLLHAFPKRTVLGTTSKLV